MIIMLLFVSSLLRISWHMLFLMSVIFFLKFLQTLHFEKYVQHFTSRLLCLVGELYFLSLYRVDDV